MADVKFTPGPWRACSFSSVVGCPITAQPDPTKNTINVAGTRSAAAENEEDWKAEVIANAHLIAASPDLYEALKDLRACIMETRGTDASDAVIAADAALKKAEGRS